MIIMFQHVGFLLLYMSLDSKAFQEARFVTLISLSFMDLLFTSNNRMRIYCFKRFFFYFLLFQELLKVPKNYWIIMVLNVY